MDSNNQGIKVSLLLGLSLFLSGALLLLLCFFMKNQQFVPTAVTLTAIGTLFLFFFYWVWVKKPSQKKDKHAEEVVILTNRGVRIVTGNKAKVDAAIAEETALANQHKQHLTNEGLRAREEVRRLNGETSVDDSAETLPPPLEEESLPIKKSSRKWTENQINSAILFMVVLAFFMSFWEGHKTGSWGLFVVFLIACSVFGISYYKKWGVIWKSLHDDVFPFVFKHWKSVWLSVSLLAFIFPLMFNLTAYPSYWFSVSLSLILSAVTMFDGWKRVNKVIWLIYKKTALLLLGILLIGLAISKDFHNLLSENNFFIIGMTGFLLIPAWFILSISKSINSKKITK